MCVRDHQEVILDTLHFTMKVDVIDALDNEAMVVTLVMTDDLDLLTS